jgi:hypothetical protein
MLVVQKNGHTTVVSGWRAWLLAFGLVLGAVAAFFFLAFVFLGIALTIGAVVLIALPVAVGIAIFSALFGRRP